MRAAFIIAALGDDVPLHIVNAIHDLDARAYRSNEALRLNEAQTYLRLRDAVKSAGSEAAFAKKIGITRQSMSDIMNSRRPMPPSVLKAIGLREVKSRVYAPLEI
ncbi:helix-turn-helix transcriptional regulator [Devosia sp. Leaf64]|uniref:helix-turn-helix domain-containing protein n=1 Tax=Devosia sp. Leaf64 TaxID=1736229 RepID=UPI00071351F2|nr:helix-turn-helix transcriptional regulator [Devosia sp. Leaf64]KQN75032.1 hypothetical protein ASE94_01555 [Devosia sp. Leaf64]